MSNRPLTAKQASFVQYYADPGSDTYNNATQSMIKAGYAAKWAEDNCNRLTGNDRIKQAVGQYKAKTSAKLDHNRTIAIKLLTDNVAALDAIILKQPLNVAAVTARTGAIRELNAISNLHKTTIITEHTPDQPHGVEAEMLDKLAKQYKQGMAGPNVKLVKTGS